MPLIILICFSAVFLSADSPASTAKVNWSDVVAVASVAFNVVMAVLLWLLNRKHEAEQELRKRSQDQLDAATARVRECDLAGKQVASQLDQVRREIDSLHSVVSSLADDAVVTEVRSDFRSMKRDLEDTRISLAGHQNSCADRFVHRSSYSEDQRTQRESIGLLHEILNQQRDVVERMRRGT
jgi:hypothetical protein